LKLRKIVTRNQPTGRQALFRKLVRNISIMKEAIRRIAVQILS
jgi:hypothetical protein